MLMSVDARRKSYPDYLTTARAAAVLGTTKRTLHNWVSSGRIPKPSVNPANGYYCWTLSDIEVVRALLKEEK